MPILITIILIFIYGGLGAYVWGFWKNRASDNYSYGKELAILGVTLLLHTALIWMLLIDGQMIALSFGQTLNLVVWLMLLMYWMGSFFYNLKGLQILLYPLAVFALVLSILFPGQGNDYAITHFPFVLHITVSVLAYCLFGIATLFAVLIILVEHDLRKKRMSALMAFLPSLLGLETLMFHALWAGFICLTVSVIGGVFFTEYIFHVPFEWTHKSIFGLSSWFIYAILLWMRVRHSWRGKKVAWWVIIGFLSLMLAYIGSKFVLEVILGRVH